MGTGKGEKGEQRKGKEGGEERKRRDRLRGNQKGEELVD